MSPSPQPVPSLHDELLATAKRLIATAAPMDADARRAISTAYYALFHRLVDAAVRHLLPQHSDDQRASLARNFEHTKMKGVCKSIKTLQPTSALAPVLGQPVPQQLKDVAEAFVNLQQSRSEADYNRNPPSHQPITGTTANGAIRAVETAFADWAAIEGTAVAQAFLLLLLLGEPKSR